jgi:16S rRNA (cytidine1402-2'-O)-methyltransferase
MGYDLKGFQQILMTPLDSDSSTSAEDLTHPDASHKQEGVLYIVPTPIGNLEDITLRALRILKDCDVILAEDTRHTGQLLKHFEIKKPMLSYHKFNEAARRDQILERLGQGQQLALVSDAGTPGISDPGQRIVTETIAKRFRVEPLPGACALTTALSACGLPTDEFHFVGFLDRKSARRRRRLEECLGIPGTLVLYESPHRIEKLLEELNDIMPDRNVVFARELTKKFEQWVRGTASDLFARRSTIKAKGEFVVLISQGNA